MISLLYNLINIELIIYNSRRHSLKFLFNFIVLFFPQQIQTFTFLFGADFLSLDSSFCELKDLTCFGCYLMHDTYHSTNICRMNQQIYNVFKQAWLCFHTLYFVPLVNLFIPIQFYSILFSIILQFNTNRANCHSLCLFFKIPVPVLLLLPIIEHFLIS